MFSKFLFTLAFVLGLAMQGYAHAAFAPPIGVTAKPVRNDVKRPSTAAQCGAGVNIATALKTTTAIKASGNTFAVTATSFNGGADGSLKIAKMQIDTTATGKSFVDAKAAIPKTNGNPAPASATSQNLSVTLPAGTTCTGGADGKSCLVSMTTTAGFGNCVLVSQAAGTAAAANNAAKTKGNKREEVDIRAVGSRAARAYRRVTEESE